MYTITSDDTPNLQCAKKQAKLQVKMYTEKSISVHKTSELCINISYLLITRHTRLIHTTSIVKKQSTFAGTIYNASNTHMSKLKVCRVSSAPRALAMYTTEQYTPIHAAHFNCRTHAHLLVTPGKCKTAIHFQAALDFVT